MKRRFKGFKKRIFAFLLALVLCLSALGTSFLAPQPVKAMSAASALDWFLTLIGSAGYSYTTKDKADSGRKDVLESLASDSNILDTITDTTEVTTKVTWMTSEIVKGYTKQQLKNTVDYISDLFSKGKEAAAEAHPDVNYSDAAKLAQSKLKSWVTNKFPGVGIAAKGNFSNAFSRFTPLTELTEPAAILLTESIPEGLKDYQFGRVLANILNAHAYGYTSPSTSRFFVGVVKFGFSDDRVHFYVGHLDDAARYINIRDLTASNDGINFYKLTYDWYCYISGPSASTASGISFTTSTGKALYFLGFPANRIVSGNSILNSDADYPMVSAVTFNDTADLKFVDSDLSDVSDSGDSIVKIADSVSDTVPDEAVSADDIVEKVVAALEAGRGKAEDIDFSAVTDAIAAGNEQNHEDNQQQLAKLGLIASLLAELFDFLKSNAASMLSSITNIGTWVKNIAENVAKLADVPTLLSNTYDFLKNNIAGAGSVLSDINTAVGNIFSSIAAFDIHGIISAINALDAGILSTIGNAASVTIPGAIDRIEAAINVLPIDNIAEALASIPDVLGIDITNVGQTIVGAIEGLQADVKVISDPIVTALDSLGIGQIIRALESILAKVTTIDAAVAVNPEAPEDPGNNDVSAWNVLLALITILILLLKIFIDCLIFITAIFNIPADPYFLNEGMIQGLDWLKSTEITGLGVSIHGFLMSLITIIVIFAVVGTLKRHIHRIRIK